MSRRLSFSLPPEIDSPVLASAPVTVLNHDLALVLEARLGEDVDLEPGVYSARTVLPDGREFEKAFELPKEGDFGPVVLASRDELKQKLDETLAAFAAASEGTVTRVIKTVPHAVREAVGFGFGLIDDFKMAMQSRRSCLLLISIEPATGMPKSHRELHPDKWGKVDIEPSVERRVVRLERPGHADLNMAIPTSDQEGVRIRYAPGTDQVLDVRLQDEAAELMRRYLVSVRSQQLSQTLQTHWSRAREMLAGKFERPIAATVGAYALISVGAPVARREERPQGAGWLNDWTENLFSRFPWLPDGAYLRAEILARQGLHSQALEVLLREAPARGLPMFSLGLRFALDRLSAYRSAASSFDWARQHLEATRALLDSLTALALYTDFAQPLLAFTTNADGRPGSDARTSGDPVEAPVPGIEATA